MKRDDPIEGLATKRELDAVLAEHGGTTAHVMQFYCTRCRQSWRKNLGLRVGYQTGAILIRCAACNCQIAAVSVAP